MRRAHPSSIPSSTPPLSASLHEGHTAHTELWELDVDHEVWFSSTWTSIAGILTSEATVSETWIHLCNMAEEF